MEFREVVRRRRMVRRYGARPVDPAVVDGMLEHAVHAPSAGFSQGWAFLRLDEPEAIERFWRTTTPEEEWASPESRNGWLAGMTTAPVVIVPLSNKDAYLDRYAQPDKGWTDRDESRWPVPYWHIDTGMATLLILQTAVDEGLGACFFGIQPERIETFREAFGVPPEYTPIGAITVGHRAEDPGSRGSAARRPRRTTAEVVHHGHWGKTG
jgi:nitroreductase